MAEDELPDAVHDESRCPECGEPPVDANERPSDLGYSSDDILLTCDNDHQWWIGPPMGSWEREITECPSCGGRGLPHFLLIPQDQAITWGGGRKDTLKFKLILKCETCGHPYHKEFNTDEQGRFLFGYAEVTGDIEDATPKGWLPDEEE